jgi:hypothetical protein
MECQSCGYRDKHYLTAEETLWRFVCPECKRGIYEIVRLGNRGVRGYAFQPFVTEEITGDPVEVTSPQHRDQLLAASGLTLDRYSDLSHRLSRHREESRTSNQITLDQVMKAAKERAG